MSRMCDCKLCGCEPELVLNISIEEYSISDGGITINCRNADKHVYRYSCSNERCMLHREPEEVNIQGYYAESNARDEWQTANYIESELPQGNNNA